MENGSPLILSASSNRFLLCDSENQILFSELNEKYKMNECTSPE